MADYTKLKICVADAMNKHSNGTTVQAGDLDTRIEKTTTQSFSVDKLNGDATKTEGLITVSSVNFVSYRDGQMVMAGASFTPIPIYGDMVSSTKVTGNGDAKEVTQMVKEVEKCMASKETPKLTKPITNYKP